MIDVEGGNNLTYLPLDQLMRQPREPVAAGADGTNPNMADTVSSTTRSALEELRRSRGNLRGRDR